MNNVSSEPVTISQARRGRPRQYKTDRERQAAYRERADKLSDTQFRHLRNIAQDLHAQTYINANESANLLRRGYIVKVPGQSQWYSMYKLTDTGRARFEAEREYRNNLRSGNVTK